MKKYKKFSQLCKDQKGQADIIGNIISIIQIGLNFVISQPWLAVILFLSLLYVTTLKFSLFGFELQLGAFYNEIFSTIFGAVGFNFDYRLFVILCFSVALLGFTMALHKGE